MLFVGHRNLWQAGILHGDVSINNVLIGKPNAEVGNRGVLIDMDMAILLDRMELLASVDFRTVSGSRLRVLRLSSSLINSMVLAGHTSFPVHIGALQCRRYYWPNNAARLS